MNNNGGQQAIIAVQEERARIGGIEVAKKTVIAATEEGLVWLTAFIGVALPCCIHFSDVVIFAP